uniref:Beta-lactamase-related domain-containing protein n=1 Tax=Panagrolaimus sp. PS1159 TaxID=55785 RepID=A0AC35GUQ1_9BILA
MNSWFYSFFYKKSIYIDGFVEPGYEAIKEAFEQNFLWGWEPEGASLAVYHSGKLIADLWGGYADKECRRIWKKDTISCAFSSTKAVAALCVALLVDKNLIRYDDKIVEFWPEFGKYGKEEITVQWILSHLSGLAYFDVPIEEEDARDWKRMAKLIENEKPKWEPGTAVGYHAITYGWLVDQIIRRADPKNRSLAQFFKDEIQENSDFHIGLDPFQAYRVARLKSPSVVQRISEFCTNPKAINYIHIVKDLATNGIFSKIEKNPEWFKFFKGEITLNNPDLFTLEQSGAFGIGNARSLAEIFQRAIFDRKVFKNAETLNRLTTPFTKERDMVTGVKHPRGQGFCFIRYFHKSSGTLCQTIGHHGFGGQNIKFDLENELCFGYVSNGLKCGLGDNARTFEKLQHAIYDCVLLNKKHN